MNEPFSWSDYLKETGAIAAPAECFFQDPVPPKNKFEVGKKVEVPDPRGALFHTLYCHPELVRCITLTRTHFLTTLIC